MALGIPVVCNDIGDTGQIVETSKAGSLVHEFTVAEYRRVINQLQPSDRLNKEQIRAGAFEYFDLEKGTRQYAGVYELL